ncbi:MAG: flagellar basal-body rod protein FlgF [Deltaproteobacteria bacterium]|nr:flagellar basal-body rod protein FlgF [Deltaproteobacteria bacterium]
MINANVGAVIGKRYLEIKMDTIANNLSNANTAGYKNIRLYLNPIPGGGQERGRATLPELGAIDSYVDFSVGPMVETGNPLDLAIDGEGFFVVMSREGRAYTRAGQFTLNAQRMLVTPDGLPVLGEQGEIFIQGSDVKIERDGSIFVDGNPVGKLRLADFQDKRSLKPIGKGLYVNTDPRNVESLPKRAEVRQGYIETSNVNVIRELTEMIIVLRAFEMYTRVEQMQSESKAKLFETLRF